MAKLFLALLFCCLGLACADGLAESDKGIVTGEGVNLSAENTLVKREAFPGAGKNNVKKKKSQKGRRKSSRGKKNENRPRKYIRKENKERRKMKKKKTSKTRTGGSKQNNKKSIKGKKTALKNKKSTNKNKKSQTIKEKKRKSKKTEKGKRPAKKRKTKTETKKERPSKNIRKMNNAIYRQTTNYTSCVAKFIEYSRINELKARSIEQQVNRINSFKGIQDKKKVKKGNFKGTYDTLLSALGGNESSPECDGKPINGTTRSAKYKDTLSTLKECETKINSVCNYELNTTYNSTLQGCLTAAKQFKKEFKTCFDVKKSSAEACTCVDTIDTANYDKLKACNTKSASDDIKVKKKACIKGFITCKTAQDDSVDGVGTCKKVNRCGGAPNKTEAARLLKILNPLKEALANTKFAAALTKLGLNAGAGSDGKLPARTRLTQLRLARLADSRQSNSTDGQGCKDIEAEWKNFNTSGDKAVPGVDGDVDSDETTNTISSLDKLNNRASLETDLGSCAKEDARQLTVTVTLTIVKIRFYVFWCGWFQVTVVEIKITIITISFGLPSLPSPSPAPAPVATSAPGGGRHIAKQIIKRAAFSKK